MISQTLHKQVHDKGRTPKMPRKGRITKSEIRNSKPERRKLSGLAWVFYDQGLWVSGFGFHSDFGFDYAGFFRDSTLVIRHLSRGIYTDAVNAAGAGGGFEDAHAAGNGAEGEIGEDLPVGRAKG